MHGFLGRPEENKNAADSPAIKYVKGRIEIATKAARAFVSEPVLESIALAEVAKWVYTQSDDADPARVVAIANELTAWIYGKGA